MCFVVELSQIVADNGGCVGVVCGRFGRSKFVRMLKDGKQIEVQYNRYHKVVGEKITMTIACTNNNSNQANTAPLMLKIYIAQGVSLVSIKKK